MGIMTDRQFEEFLRNTAQDYNRPPEATPHTEIWAEIDEARNGSWQRSQWREAAPWWSWGRGIAATLALWLFPLTAVAGGAALAINHWSGDSGSEFSVLAADHGLEGEQHGECSDVDTRVAALNALLQMDTEQAMPILMDVLERRDACSVELRRKAVFLVSQHETRETVDILLRAVREDPDEEVRQQAVFWLGQTSADDAVTALESILQGSDDIELQKKVIFSLSQHGSSRAGSILRDVALDSRAHEEVREQAIFWLGQEGSSEDVAFLMDMYKEIDDRDLKEKVIFAVSQNSDRDGDEWLLSLVRDKNESVDLRKNALFWVGQEGDIDASELRALYNDAAEFELKEHVIFVLSQFDEVDAVDELMNIARNETNADLRDKAIFWLGQSDDERAAEFLAELINRPTQ
jgi:HEAT repeat protein